MALDHGVLINEYRADNGIFKANEFVAHIRERNQKMSYCGVNAHHKNGVAERAVRTVSECARALLLHAACHWEHEVTSDLWPMAVDYAVYIYNRLPNEKGIAPIDLFTGMTAPRHKLRDLHKWGAPVYVLDPVLQAGKKLPRWQPRSRRGMFVGFSNVHSSDVPLILNLRTGHVSPQYHVVFDDDFSTVCSIPANADPPSWWNEIDLEENSIQIPLDENTPAILDKDWLSPEELEERSRHNIRQAQLRLKADVASVPNTEQSTAPTTTTSVTSESSSPPPIEEPSTDNTATLPTSPIKTLPEIPPSPVKLIKQEPSPSPAKHPSPYSHRRSSRNTKGERVSQYFHDEFHLASVKPSEKPSSMIAKMAYTAELETDWNSGEIHCSEPRAYAEKFKVYNEDNPSFNMALSGEHAHEWQKAMIDEVKGIMKQKTWINVKRNDIPKGTPVLPGIWAFKLKRLPDGSPSKYKARYCVRGDKQVEGVDYFETYAPVVQWSTIRLVLTMVLANNWVTRQVDYTNAFTQATLNEEVYIGQPKGFGRKDK